MNEEHTVALPGRLLSLGAAAIYLHTTERTVRRLIARGILHPVQIPTLRRVLIDRADIDRLIDDAKAVLAMEASA
ncbi:MAG: helix-turn-helix domain-containing protein [Candidatus Entotheonellia bacterium]